MSQFKLVQPRETIEIKLPDGRVYEGDRNSTLGQFFKSLPEAEDPLIVCGIVNGSLRELTYPLKMECEVVPVTVADADGARIYRRSLTFLLEAAFQELYPAGVLKIDHAVTSGGFYCTVEGRDPLSVEELANLEKHMRELVEKDLPFERKEVPLQEAIEYFRKKKQTDKVRLLKYRQKKYLVLSA